jgi:predicted outer membrane repeat protein
MISYLIQRRAAKIDFLKLLLIILFLALSFAFPFTASGAVWYVHAHSDSGDGTNWAHAFKTIQEAIYAASTGDEIWLKEGTYNIYTQINVNKAIGVYGGFKGYETQREQRDWANNVTRIDGDGSVYHCLYVTADATVDGITITGGNADGSGSVASSGGGIYNEDYSSPTITNCKFLVNNAESTGGAIYNSYYSCPTITNCIFLGNNSAGYGGAMYNNLWSSPTISNCTFSSNNAQWWGGGISGTNSATITNCTFSDNSASLYGGGIHNLLNSPTISNCMFSGNYAGWGGGVYNNDSFPTISNCTFSDNNANRGGGMNNFDSSPTITNCTFSNNSANYKGGAIENDENSSPTITNSIIWNNTAPDGPEIYNDETSSPKLAYSDIQGGYNGTANIDKDPLFVDPENNDFHLKGSSPCIDTGYNYAVGIYTTDFEGEPRIADGNIDGTATVDMGADEYAADTDKDGLPDDWEKRYFGDLNQSPNGDYDGDGLSNLEEYALGSNPARAPVSFYVNCAVESSGDGINWANALKTIEEAIDVASTGDEIWLKRGTYLLSSQINVNKAIAIYGGFNGDETKREERDWENNSTKIDGQSSVYHCFYVAADAIIDGITITGGNADGSSWPDNSGGGIFNNENSSPIITNCMFLDNNAQAPKIRD